MSLEVPPTTPLGDVFATVAVGVLAVDGTGRVIAANPQALETLGRPEDAVLGAHAHDLLHGSVAEPVGCSIEQALMAGRLIETEGDTFRTESGLLPVSWLASPLRDRDGIALVFRNDTAQRVRAVVEAAEREHDRVELATAHQSVAELEWLAELTQWMSGTLDEFEVLRRVAQAIAGRFADVVIADVIGTDGTVQRVGGFGPTGADPRAVQLLEHPQVTHVLAEASPSMQIIRAGELVRLDAGQLEDPTLIGESSRILLTSLGAQQVLVVPLTARAHPVGALALVRRDASHVFSAVDEAVCADLARRAALAVDNARLYHAQSAIALQLQQALLPHPVDGLIVESSVRYIPARHHFDVGGDWYDLFPCPGEPGTVVLVIGDVSGHDLAAATRMAAVRNLLRGIVVSKSTTPAGVVTTVDDNLAVLGIEGTASTVVMTATAGDAPGEDWTLAWSNAGHVPPLLIEPDGSVQLLEQVHGPILGTGLAADRTTSQRRVPAGSTVVLYTDGLVESRDEPIEASLARFVEIATGLTEYATEPAALLDELVRRCQAGAEDDTAILVCRLPG